MSFIIPSPTAMATKPGVSLLPLRLPSLFSQVHVVTAHHNCNVMCRIPGCGNTATRMAAGRGGTSYAYCSRHDMRRDAELAQTCCISDCKVLSTQTERVGWADGPRKYCASHTMADDQDCPVCEVCGSTVGHSPSAAFDGRITWRCFQHPATFP